MMHPDQRARGRASQDLNNSLFCNLRVVVSLSAFSERTNMDKIYKEKMLEFKPSLYSKIKHPVKNILGGLRYRLNMNTDTFEVYHRKPPYIIPWVNKKSEKVRTIREIRTEGNLLEKKIIICFNEDETPLVCDGVGIIQTRKVLEYLDKMKKKQMNITFI